MPEMITGIQMLHSMPFSFKYVTIGNAHIATPTPNQPICVIARMADGSAEPRFPKERRARRWTDRPVDDAMYANADV